MIQDLSKLDLDLIWRVTEPCRRSGKLALERPYLLKSLSHVAQKCCDAHHLTASIPQQHNCEFDRDLMAVLPACRNGEHIAFTIATPPRLHGTVVAIPMALT
jgi:hypothetical protein